MWRSGGLSVGAAELFADCMHSACRVDAERKQRGSRQEAERKHVGRMIDDGTRQGGITSTASSMSQGD